MKKSELRKIIKEEIKYLIESTTWTDIGVDQDSSKRILGVPFKGFAPNIRGWYLLNNSTKQKFKIKSTDEKFIQLDGADEVPVGDGLVYSDDWTLMSPSGKKFNFRKK